jgi:hypothetical protein
MDEKLISMHMSCFLPSILYRDLDSLTGVNIGRHRNEALLLHRKLAFGTIGSAKSRKVSRQQSIGMWLGFCHQRGSDAHRNILPTLTHIA